MNLHEFAEEQYILEHIAFRYSHANSFQLIQMV